MGILMTSMARRLRAFPRVPRKVQRIRDSARDLGAWAQTVRSRWGIRRFKGPIIAITGTKGKTTSTLLVSRIFRDAGYRVGTACSNGIYVDGHCIIPGSYGGADGLNIGVKCGVEKTHQRLSMMRKEGGYEISVRRRAVNAVDGTGHRTAEEIGNAERFKCPPAE